MTTSATLPSISAPEGSPLASLAARELREALDTLPVSPVARIEIVHGAAGEGFVWSVEGDALRIEGDGPHGALYGAYDWLESLGFAWPAPDATKRPDEPHDLAPRRPRQAPALRGRSLILGHHAFMAAAQDWIVWAARNRLNTIFFHVDEHGLGLAAIPGAQWRARRDAALAALAAARERGMTLELGGHGLSALMPKGAFAAHPDWFPVRGGERAPRHNLDPRSAEALAAVCDAARAWFAANPGFDVYHLWPDDLPGGGWCEAAAGSGLSPSDQSMIVANALAETLAGIAPDAKLAWLCYHDTEAPPSIPPRANVVLTFAPRLRCFAASLDAPHPVNAKYPDLWRANAALFPGEGRARVFEYWLDAFLFKLVAPPMVEVIRRDLAFYAANGAQAVGALATGAAPFVAPSLNAYAFARLAWNPKQDAAAIRQDFCAHVFGSSLHMPAYFEALERAFAKDLDFAPEEARLAASSGLERMLDAPPVDIGSPFNTPDDLVGETQLRQEAALDLMDEASRLFEPLMRPTHGDPDQTVLHEECHRYLCHARLLLRAALLDVRAAQTAGASRDVTQAVRQARAHLNAIEKEMRAFVQEPYISNTRLLLWLMIGLSLDKAEDDLIEGDGARRKRRRNRLETARQNVARLGALWI